MRPQERIFRILSFPLFRCLVGWVRVRVRATELIEDVWPNNVSRVYVIVEVGQYGKPVLFIALGITEHRGIGSKAAATAL